MTHARVGPNYCWHALKYCARHIYNALPIKGLYTAQGIQSTPYEMAHGKKPRIQHLRTLFCPCVYRKLTAHKDGQIVPMKKSSQKGVRGIFIGFPDHQQGYLIFVPSTRQIVVSGDVTFDETFQSIVSLTSPPFHDAMAMKPNTSLSKDSEEIIETTGDIEDLAHITPVPVHENIISEIQDTQQPSDSLVTDIEIVQDSNLLSHCRIWIQMMSLQLPTKLKQKKLQSMTHRLLMMEHHSELQETKLQGNF